MKRLFSLALCLVLLVTPALAVVDKPANGYVGDYAGVLDAELEQDIIRRNENLFQSTGAEIVVVAVEFMDGLDAESYAMACFDDWGIGSAERNNGLLLVFATQDRAESGLRKCWVMKGVGLEDALSDVTLNGWMEDYFYPGLDSGDYDTAVRDFFDAAYDWLDSYYATGGPQPETPAAGREERSLLGPMVGFTLVVVVALVLLIALSSRPRHGTGYYAPYVYRPRFFWFGRRRRYGPPPPPAARGYRPNPGGDFHFGGASRGGGVGRGGGGSVRSSARSSPSRSSRSSGSFRSGGHSRGGGVGRR